MTRRVLGTGLVWACALALAACGRGTAPPDNGARGNANQPARAANASQPGPDALASGQLDAEMARLEAEAEKNPDDDAPRAAVAAAYVRRANALRAAGRADEALRDYQKALSFNPDNEDAQLGLEQLNQEAGAEPRADDGRPVTVPTGQKPEDGKQKPEARSQKPD
ncbi:MAG TPA: tetratricopeptide repeat protein [Pyrinomonadaceae bacterium]|jgi:tetratricopeptide (TPR) repeat protein